MKVLILLSIFFLFFLDIRATLQDGDPSFPAALQNETAPQNLEKRTVIRGNTNHEEVIARFIAASIRADQIDEAFDTYTSFPNGQLFIFKILEEAYYANVNNFGLCLMFGERLPTQYEQFKFWQYLYYVMKFSDHLNTIQTFDLLQKLNGIEESMLIGQDKKFLSTMKSSLKKIHDEASYTLNEIDLNNYYRYYSRYTNVLVENDSRIYEIIKKLITNTYSYTSLNYNDWVKYNNRAFSHLNLQGIGVKIINNWLSGSTSNAILNLAASVKSIMESPEFLIADNQTKTLYFNLQNGFKPKIRLLLWENVCIKSFLTNVTLFADDIVQFMERSDADHPISWWNSTYPRNGVWKFETYDTGDNFLIKNVRLNEYAYTSLSLINGTCDNNYRRKMFTKKIYCSAPVVEVAFKWKIYLLDSNANKVKISSVYNGYYIGHNNTCAINSQRVITYTGYVNEPDSNFHAYLEKC